MSGLIIVKYGEIALKGGNRAAFEDTLRRNLVKALQDVPNARVERERGRFTVHVADPERALPKVARVFGVVGVSLAKLAPLNMDDIQAAATETLQTALRAGKRTFKVEARRANKDFPLTTPQINSIVGERLLQTCPAAAVDVHQPDVTIHIEVREKAAYLYSDTLQGPGGLPLGSGGKGLLLISGGIDSPVAGWLAMRRGISLEAIHFHSAPYTSERAKRKTRDLVGILAAYGGDITMHMVHFTDVQVALRDNAPPALMVTLMRRIMLRVAQKIAEQRRIPALVTGENVGQVASQTLESMAAINAVTRMPILRPLVVADKRETTWLAKQIGTYETSILPYEDCCTLFLPPHPETRPRIGVVEAAEAKLDINGMVAACLEKTAVETVGPHPGAALYSGGPLTYF